MVGTDLIQTFKWLIHVSTWLTWQTSVQYFLFVNKSDYIELTNPTVFCDVLNQYNGTSAECKELLFVLRTKYVLWCPGLIRGKVHL